MPKTERLPTQAKSFLDRAERFAMSFGAFERVPQTVQRAPPLVARDAVRIEPVDRLLGKLDGCRPLLAGEKRTDEQILEVLDRIVGKASEHRTGGTLPVARLAVVRRAVQPKREHGRSSTQRPVFDREAIDIRLLQRATSRFEVAEGQENLALDEIHAGAGRHVAHRRRRRDDLLRELASLAISPLPAQGGKPSDRTMERSDARP